MKVGDIVICVYDENLPDLTKGKKYKIMDFIAIQSPWVKNEKYLVIINDDGKWVDCHHSHFKLLSEIREEKINVIFQK